MKIRFDVTAEELAIIQGVLSRHLSDDCKVWVFGSRAKNSARFNSDLDLAIECKAKLPQKSVSELKEDFDDSKLAFAVDVVDMNGIEAYFKKIIDAQKVVFPLKSKTPKLRFPEFGGEWEEKRLIELSENGFSNGAFNDPKRVGRGYRIINVKDMYVDGAIDVNNLSRVDIDEKEFLKNRVEYGDIFFTRSSLVKEGIAYSNVNLSDVDDLTFDGHLIRMRPKKDECSPVFLYYNFATEKSRIQFVQRGKTTTMTTIGQEDIATVAIFLPKKQEQQKIADFLTVVDARIEALTKQQELTEQYKKGVMQKIFLQEIRFRADDGSEFSEWEYRELAEIAVKNTNKNSSNKISFVLTNSASKGIVSQQDYFDKDIANQNNLDGYYIVDINDFVYNPRISILAPVGPIKRNKLRQGVMSPLYTVFTCHAVNLDFMEKYFDTATWHDYMFSIANYGARHDRMAISNGDFFKMPILLPSLAEQTKIANFLSSIDNKLEAISSELQVAKKFKKALLQQMFV